MVAGGNPWSQALNHRPGANYFLYICIIDQACSVKMDGYGPSSFSCFQVNKNARKKTRPTFSHIHRTSLVFKGFIIWPKRELFHAKKMLEITSGQDGPIFLAQVANQNAVFASSCPLMTQLYIYNSNNIYYELSSKGKVCFCLCFFLCISIGSTDQWPLVHFLLTVFSM